MPIYEYECEGCGGVVESWQKISDPPLTRCGACGGDLHKLVSQSSFHLKGSGWYVTDYAGKKPGNGATTAAKGKETGATGSDQKAEKTPDTCSTKPDA